MDAWFHEETNWQAVVANSAVIVPWTVCLLSCRRAVVRFVVRVTIRYGGNHVRMLAVLGVLSSGSSFRRSSVVLCRRRAVVMSCAVCCPRAVVPSSAIVDGVPRLAIIAPSSCRCVVTLSCHCAVVPL